MFDTDIIYEDRLSETDNSFTQGDKINCSTPVKLKVRRSYSLVDVSSIHEEPQKSKKLNVSTDTIGSDSQNSLCKDSGYVYSESNTSLNSNKEHKRLIELINDLKFKEVLISELQESNHTLRLKYAEAENRIAELRLKCETHCDCCNLKTIPSSVLLRADRSRSGNKFSCFNETNSLYLSTAETKKSVTPYQIKNHSIVPTANDDSFIKVRRWQENINMLNGVSPDTSISGANVLFEPSSNLPIMQTRMIKENTIRVLPASKLNPLQMANNLTNRHSADTEPSTSVIAPSKDVTLIMENLHNLITGINENKRLDLTTVSEDELPTIVESVNKSSLSSPSLTNFQVLSSSDDGKSNKEEYSINGECRTQSERFFVTTCIDRKSEMEKTIREEMNIIAERGRSDEGMKYKPWETTSCLEDTTFSNTDWNPRNKDFYGQYL